MTNEQVQTEPEGKNLTSEAIEKLIADEKRHDQIYGKCLCTLCLIARHVSKQSVIVQFYEFAEQMKMTTDEARVYLIGAGLRVEGRRE